MIKLIGLTVHDTSTPVLWSLYDDKTTSSLLSPTTCKSKAITAYQRLTSSDNIPQHEIMTHKDYVELLRANKHKS